MKHYSEFRRDIISGEWVLIVPGRFSGHVKLKRIKRRSDPKSKCPFEPSGIARVPVLARYPNNDAWRVAVIPNRYPAVKHSSKPLSSHKLGLNRVGNAFPGCGHHELVVTRDHRANFSELPFSEALLTFRTFRDRYRAFYGDRDVTYVSISQNRGPRSGATVTHPHYQVLGIPILPPHVARSLAGSGRYFHANRVCAHCAILKWELKQKKRIILENANAIAIAPFTSRNPFEVTVFPKVHMPSFEETSESVLRDVADMLQKVLLKIKKNLKDPDYNFFIHTIPVKDKQKYGHYHWHIEIFPKFTIGGGFDIGTGVDISVVDPDFVAKTLRK